MDSRQYEQKIEQLIVELEGAYGLLNEVVSYTELFLPILRQLPQTDKNMLAELEKRILISKQTFSMRRNNPATITSSLW